MRETHEDGPGTEAAAHLASRASIVHAAAALYLGLGGSQLREVLDVGVSLADVAEWQGMSLDGLEHALRSALGRTGDGHVSDLAALVDELVEVAEEGAGAWQRSVEDLVRQRMA